MPFVSSDHRLLLAGGLLSPGLDLTHRRVTSCLLLVDRFGTGGLDNVRTHGGEGTGGTGGGLDTLAALGGLVGVLLVGTTVGRGPGQLGGLLALLEHRLGLLVKEEVGRAVHADDLDATTGVDPETGELATHNPGKKGEEGRTGVRQGGGERGFVGDRDDTVGNWEIYSDNIWTQNIWGNVETERATNGAGMGGNTASRRRNRYAACVVHGRPSICSEWNFIICININVRGVCP